MAECLVWIQAIVVQFRVIPVLPLRVLRLGLLGSWPVAECLVRIQAIVVRFRVIPYFHFVFSGFVGIIFQWQNAWFGFRRSWFDSA